MRRSRRRVGVGSLLLMLAVVPMTGVVALAAVSAGERWDDRRVSAAVHGVAHRMQDLIAARTAVMQEGIASVVLLKAADLGWDPAALLELFDIDYIERLAAARRLVDRNPTLRDEPALASRLEMVRMNRPAVDQLAVSYFEGRRPLDALSDEIDQQWLAANADLEATLARGAVPDAIDVLADGARRTFEVLTAGDELVTVADVLVSSPPTAEALRTLIASEARLSEDFRAVRDKLGSRGAAAYDLVRTDSASDRFTAATERLIDDLLDGREPVEARDLQAYGTTFGDSVRWMFLVTDLAGAASNDLDDAAAAHAAADARVFRQVVGLALAILVASVVAAVAISRAITRPLRRIGVAIEAVHDGSFDLPPLDLEGPSELADTIVAINDMALTLAAVEASAVALVEDSTGDGRPAEIPGRTGRALQAALDRLHSLAVRDGLTGLLNRSAALEAIARDSARAERLGHRIMAIFVDVDGLKTINDTFGHGIGDDALAAVAATMRSSSRAGDIVALFGGDEFVVAGMVAGGVGEAEALAARLQAELDRVAVSVDGVELRVRCSVGMATADPATSTVDELLARADEAMYTVKAAHRAAAA
ncbi:MAG TPA: sensor domain-containing diguanylate cyclase [Acidimicrobiales bacterium]|nr:sensor domain-containing diguanylate cyclase [Acidimicrobiales bacterium]